MFCDGIIITEHQGALYHTFRREGLLLILMIRDAPAEHCFAGHGRYLASGFHPLHIHTQLCTSSFSVCPIALPMKSILYYLEEILMTVTWVE